MSWRDFWNGSHCIYVNDRHRTLHYQAVARDIAAFVPGPDADVLDHGCGEAHSAGDVAAVCKTLYLYDAAPNVQDKLRSRFAYEERIIVLSNSALAILPGASLDLVVANSLLQYLKLSEFEELLEFWRARLKPGGRLVLADVIPADASPLQDVKALLTFAMQGGFLLASFRGLAATFFSDYRKLRGEIGLTHYAEDSMLALLTAHGFKGEKAAQNIGHNGGRMTFVARPVTAGAGHS